MTYKHTAFEDSVTMRSLTKLAREKGWITETKLEKTASAQNPDLTPTNDFTSNLLKLCNGLRASGFDKQAEELESKFLQLKSAQSMYGVSNEKGEDLVHDAHPKGSHKLEGVDSKEATVEDILDKHLQILDVVNKKPTGKLSDASSILGAVKVVLSQAKGPDTSGMSVAELENGLNRNVNFASNIVNQVSGLAKGEMSAFMDFQRFHNNFLKAAEHTDIDGLKEMLSQLNAMETRLSPESWFHYVSFGQSGISESTWAIVSPLLERAKQAVNRALEYRKALDQRQAAGALKGLDGGDEDKPFQVGEVSISGSPLEGRATVLANKLRAYSLIETISSNPRAKQWVDSAIAEVEQFKNKLGRIPEGQEAVVAPTLEKELADKESKVSQFAKSWLGQA